MAALSAADERDLRKNPLRLIRHVDRGIVPFRLWNKQAQFRKLFNRVRKIAGWDGPNRAGKSIGAATIVAESLIGIPYEKWAGLPWDLPAIPPGPPRHWGCITISKDKSRDAQQRYIAERIPVQWLDCRPWNEKTGFGRTGPKCVLRNGSTVDFLSDLQREQSMEAYTWHGAWIDEAVAEWILHRVIPRLVDAGGKVMITAVAEAAWIYRVLRMRRLDVRQLEPASVELIDAITDSTMFDNELLSESEIETAAEMFGGISSAEARMRILGEYTHLEGVVFPEYIDAQFPEGHLEPPVGTAPQRWTRYEWADPGYKNPFAWLFVGVDQDDNQHIYDEIYVRGKTPEEVAALVKEKRRAHGYKEPQIPAVIDPAAEHAQHWGSAVVSVRQQLLKAGIRTTAGKSYAGSVDAQEQQIRARLIRKTLRICTNCEWTRFEFQNFKYKDPDAATGEYLDDKERRVEAHNHAIAAARYGEEHGCRFVRMERTAAPVGSFAHDLQQEAKARAAKRDKPWRT